MKFSKAKSKKLLELGVTEKQIDRLRRRLQLIRDSVLGSGTRADVVDPLEDLLKKLKNAERIVGKLSRAKEGALWLANGYLASGAHDKPPNEVCNTVEGDTGELPEFVNVSSLLRLIANATECALKNHVPKKRFAPLAPVSAVRQVVIALDDPAWKVSRGDSSRFANVCSVVFDAASGGKLRSGESVIEKVTRVGEQRPDVDRAIRAYQARIKIVKSTLDATDD
jgi:hypothetical protein